MFRRTIHAALQAIVLTTVAFIASSDAQSPTYIVNFVESAPAIDGMISSENEWEEADDPAGDWILLRSNLTQNNVPDRTNNRFAAVWNGDGIFIQHQVDYGAWQNLGRDPAGVEFLYENLNLFFDPNTDGESNQVTAPDAYHIALNQPLGEAEISPMNANAGMTVEARVDAKFGSNAGPFSSFSDIVIKQSNTVNPGSGYSEIFIPWDNFDARDPDDGFDPAVDDVGLFHPEAPDDGEEWFFNIGRIQTDGLTPVWSTASGNVFIADRPHGILRFARTGTNPCDLDNDGDCDDRDIDAMSAAVRNQANPPRFDLTGNGLVDREDRDFLINELMNTWIGDSNLDGQFSTSDFVFVFQKGHYEDDLEGNSGWADGDWNGDTEFNTSDFVAAFQPGGFEQGPRTAARAVPEPGSIWIGCLAAALLFPLLRGRHPR